MTHMRKYTQAFVAGAAALSLGCKDNPVSVPTDAPTVDALFGQAGPDSSDPSNIWFRDPPPAGATRDSGVLSPRLVPTDLSATSSGTTGNSSPAASPTGSAAIATIATPAPAANTTAQDQYFAHHHNKIADSDWAEGLAVSLAV